MSAPRAPGDHFSTISMAYAAFRPRYPRELFEFVASIAPSRHRAWDVGAGSGQATTDLAAWFEEVIGSDVSAEQIERAPAHPRIQWLVAPAESTPLTARSIDLTTVAQALHWLDHAKFYDEVRRVSVPGAAIAAWTYASPRMDGAVGKALTHLMYDTLDPYWPPERRYVEDDYRSIPFPFSRIEAPAFSLEEFWTPKQVAGYTRSWSATARHSAATSANAASAFELELERLWPGAEARRIVWPLIVLAGCLG